MTEGVADSIKHESNQPSFNERACLSWLQSTQQQQSRWSQITLSHTDSLESIMKGENNSINMDDPER
jgi:hypothetical protein